ncbi:MAG: 7TM-DISM domain-containing protein, partial [Ketobacter sp.]
MRDSPLAMNLAKHVPKHGFLWGLLLFILLFAIVLIKPAPATLPDTGELVLDAETGGVELGPYIEYAPAAKEYTPTEHANSIGADPQLLAVTGWQRAQADAISLGYQPSAYWFRTRWRTAASLGEQAWTLVINNSHIDHIELRLFQNGEQIHHWQTGDALPYSQRPIDHPMFVFPITLQADSGYQLYLRIQNTEAMELPIRLLDQPHFTTF